ncbi:MAG: S1C family serine protease [Clostridia bacterium]|nr:S1C family serine protease [Clostridia bacterium]
MKKAVIAVAAVACAAAITLCGCASKVTVVNNYNTMTDEQFATFMSQMEESGASVESMIDVSSSRAVMSNVSILSIMLDQERGSSTYYEDVAYYGSGVIVDLDKENGDAYVITNCHVVYDDTAFQPVAHSIYLYLYGQDIEGTNYNLYSKRASLYNSTYYEYVVQDDDDYRIEASVVGLSAQYDIALLKVTGSEVLKNSDARAAVFSDDDEVYAGESAYAVGNPLGEGTTVTTGVVSQDSVINQLNIKSTTYDLYREIKTDAAVNGGNSGGGFYNARGELIGIINSKLEDESVDNSAYALAGSYVKRLYKYMMYLNPNDTALTDLSFSRPYLYYSETKEYSSYYGAYIQEEQDTGYETSYSYSALDTSGTTPRARIIETVSVTSTSYGLSKGDVITHLTIKDAGGNAVEDMDITRKYMLDDALLSYRDGYTVTLTYIRGDNDPAEKDVTSHIKTYNVEP